MGKRPTISDVADLAGLSVATVDRVLNNRRPVRPDTVERVVAAAQSLSYHAVPLLQERARAHMPKVTIGFLLQKETKVFYQILAREIEIAVGNNSSIQGETEIRFVNALSADAIIAELRDLAACCDVICAVSIDHPHVADAIAEISRNQVPVISFLSPLTGGSVRAHVGVDARKAGRMAAWGLARCTACEGPIGVLIGSHRYLSHDDREIGFRTYFRQHFPEYQILESVVYLDDASVSATAAQQMLAEVPDLVGLHLIGGGVEGVTRVLEQEARRRRRAFVCHELTPYTRRGLIDGTIDMVVASPQRQLVAGAVKVAVQAAQDPERPLEDVTVPFEILTSENV